MTETPTQRADRADRMLERCRSNGRVSMSNLESVRNDLRAVANEYEDLQAERAQAPVALLPEPFGTWLDEQMQKRALSYLRVAERSHGYLSLGDIVNWRSGRTTPNLHEAYRLANALGTSLIDTLTAAGYSDVVVAIVEENDELRAANEPAIGGN